MHPFLEEQFERIEKIVPGNRVRLQPIFEAIDRTMVEKSAAGSSHAHSESQSGDRRAAPDLFNDLLTHSPYCFCILVDGRIEVINIAGLNLGRPQSRQDVVGHSLFEFLDPDCVERARADLALVEKGETVLLREYQLRAPDGTTLPIEVSAGPAQYRDRPAVQVLYRELSTSRKAQVLLGKIVTGISKHTGREFLSQLLMNLGQSLHLQAALLATRDRQDPSVTRIAASWREDGREVPDCILPAEIFTAGGKDAKIQRGDLYRDMPGLLKLGLGDMQLMAAMPIDDRDGNRLGWLAAFGRHALEDVSLEVLALRIFAERAGAELERARAEALARESEQSFRTLMEAAADGIIVTDPAGYLSYANRHICEMLGVTSEELVGRQLGEFLPEDERRRLRRDFRKLLGGRALRLERNLRSASGETLRCEISAVLLEDGRIQAIVRDMSERYRLEEERASYLETLAMLDEVAIELDRERRIVRVSESWDRLLGAAEESPRGQEIESLIHEDYRYFLVQNLEAVLRGQKNSVNVHVPVPAPDGSTNVWIEGRFIARADRTGKVTGLRGVLRDVTVDHLTDRQITFYAYFDSLTGLPNRIRMEEHLARCLSRAEQEKRKLALAFIDLDNFDEINNVMGHRSGDRVMLFVADRLRAGAQSSHSLYRWGGDKFVLLITDDREVQNLNATGQRLLEQCRTPIIVDGEPLHVSYSIGFAIYPEDGLTTDMLMGEANRALGYAKSQGKFSYKVAKEVPRKGFYRDQIQIKSDLSTAIKEGAIQPFFQPVVDAHTRRIVGMEALARWPNRHGRHAVSPSFFIPMAESMGLIDQLGNLVMESALSLKRELKDAGHNLRLSVNVSRRQLFEPRLVDQLLKKVAEHAITPGEVTLEITESIAMLEVDFAIQRLRALYEAGFQLSIDDFGTGYSTLSQLHEMPVHEIKIDMSFVRRLDTYEGLQVVQAITNMGRALKLDVVAEGVESATTAGQLADLGVNLLQGNLFAAALPARELRCLLDEFPDGLPMREEPATGLPGK